MKSRKEDPLIREQPFTYDDYARLPDDGSRYELAAGTLELMSPAPSPRHQFISKEETIRSDRLLCVSFTMKQVMESAADLPG